MTVQTAHGYIPEWTMGDRIRRARRDAHISQRALHEALVLAGVDVTPQAVGNWESGANDVSAKLRGQVAAVVALKTRVNRAWLMTGSETPDNSGPDGAEWAPWGSNPRPTDYTSVQVTGRDDLAARRALRVSAPPEELEETG